MPDRFGGLDRILEIESVTQQKSIGILVVRYAEPFPGIERGFPADDDVEDIPSEIVHRAKLSVSEGFRHGAEASEASNARKLGRYKEIKTPSLRAAHTSATRPI
jgi:hypothetical protein